MCLLTYITSMVITINSTSVIQVGIAYAWIYSAKIIHSLYIPIFIFIFFKIIGLLNFFL